MGFSSSTEQIMIDIVFGENGLIEAEDSDDLKEKLIKIIALLSQIENEASKKVDEKGKKKSFAEYIRKR